jgi:hypothetical protein
MSATLIIAVEDGSGRRFVTGTAEDTILVGRSSMADLRLVSAAISAVHVKVVASSGIVRVQDLGSKNGSFLDERQLPPQQLVDVPPGGVLDLGATFRLTFSWGAAPAAAENPFAEGEVEEDDGTARLHPAALLALREKFEKREAATKPAPPASPPPQTFRVPAAVPPHEVAVAPPRISQETSPQPPSLDLPWTGREVAAVSAPRAASTPTRTPYQQASSPAPAVRGRISLGGTADAASFGAGQAPQEPGSATVARVRVDPISGIATMSSAPAITGRPAPSPPAQQTPVRARFPTLSPSSPALDSASALAMPTAYQADSSARRSTSQEPLGELRVRLSSGEELGSATPSRAEVESDSTGRRTGPARRTAHRRTSEESPRRMSSRRPVNARHGRRPLRIALVAAAGAAILSLFAWLTLHVITSSADSPSPTLRSGSEAR